jgi:hypothetical protein
MSRGSRGAPGHAEDEDEGLSPLDPRLGRLVDRNLGEAIVDLYRLSRPDDELCSDEALLEACVAA